MDFMEKTLLISIKPSFEEAEKEIIIGTVIDMTGAHHIPVSRMKQLKQRELQKVVM
jgi:hypothetical protein